MDKYMIRAALRGLVRYARFAEENWTELTVPLVVKEFRRWIMLTWRHYATAERRTAWHLLRRRESRKILIEQYE